MPLPASQSNLSILSILLQYGFIHNITRGSLAGPSTQQYLTSALASRRLWVDLKYRPDDRPVLETMSPVSKPSRAVYMDSQELLRFATGRRAKFVTPLAMGEIAVVDCGPNGWWEARDAIKRGFGGEVVARVA